MDNSNRNAFDVVGLFKSWIPWKPEPVNVSRDFWMPDQSCRVCYECDSQFTLFNRRHHCRHCGRIFCVKCTSNWIPTKSSDPNNRFSEWNKIRVCNYCFKQWEQGLTGAIDNGHQVVSADTGCTSPTLTSFFSTKSSGACSAINFGSFTPHARLSPHQSAIIETAIEGKNVESAVVNDCIAAIGGHDHSQNQFGFSQNRSDDDEEEFGSHLSSRTSPFNDYCSHDQFDDIGSDYKSCKIHPDGDTSDFKSISSSPLHNSFDSLASEEVRQIVRKDVEHDIGDECEAVPSSLYVAGDVDTEPMDFENNGVLWLPPEPEDEEDEREALSVEENEDGNVAGEWGYLSNSSSFEEHKRAMKDVVGGHFRALVAQLLQVENLLMEDTRDQESWLEIITALSWEAATLIKPDTTKGGQMDPAGYVKVKCLASGHRSESLVIQGIVCKKNVAHRRMKSRIEKPSLLILGGALEYQRVFNALSSLDTLLQQEMDHLKMAVAKIEAQKPSILLVEKSVSRYAQEYLLAKGISLVLNIKRPLLERISRSTGAQIVPSIDHLSPAHRLGYCDLFHVERLLEEHGSAGQSGKKLVKTLMYFEGCPKPLGYTILLRGANGDELKKVKHVVQYGVFAAYHLALETSFLADEGASLPELPLNTPLTVTFPDKQSNIERSISTIPGLMIPESEKIPGHESLQLPRFNSLPASALLDKECSETCNLTVPMSSQNVEPHISSSAEVFVHSSLDDPSRNCALENRGPVDLAMSLEANSFEADRDAIGGDTNMQSDYCNDSNRNISDPSPLQLDVKVLEEQSLKEDFPPSPSENQSILVSLSSRCVWKGTVCERSHLFRIKYYGSFDKPLGRYLRDDLFDPSFVCHSCEMPAEAHVQCYTHREGSLTISVKRLSDILLPGELDGKIWMWHRCLRCPRINGFPPATRRVVMSDAAWGLSFGKFLELSFSNHAAASRVASCGHSLHRDCLRFYGFGKMVACFRYASINVHSVYVAPSKLDFNYDSQEWLEKELNEVAGKAELLFSEVLNAIRHLEEKKSGLDPVNGGTKMSESRCQLPDLEGTLLKDKLEFEESLQKIQNKEPRKGQPVIDILELNRLRRQLVFQSYTWDIRLVYAAGCDVVSKPETDQKPLGVTEQTLDMHIPVRTNMTLDGTDSIAADAKPEQIHDHGSCEMVDQRSDEFFEFNNENQNPSPPSHGAKLKDESDPLISGVTVRRTLSDGQAQLSLSDTLEAAWTGEGHQTRGITKNKSFSGLVEADHSFASVFDKLDLEDHKENLKMSKICQSPSTFSTKSTDNVEDAVSWLGMPFLSFYRSLNKNFSGNTQKLDKLNEYDLVYISSFRESVLQSGARLLLSSGIHDIVIPVYDDEPTSIVSYALVSHDYYNQLSDEHDRPKDSAEHSTLSMQSLDAGISQSCQSLEESMLESYRSLGSGDDNSSRSSFLLDPVAYTKAMHARVSFMDDGPLGKVRYTVTCYYAKRFEALRRICCPSEVDYIRSLSHCKRWGAQGGKSNVFFAKTLDDRFIIKQVTKTELESFIKFAPGYFKYLSESISSGSPTCLAKILGIYQVASKHFKGGKESKMDVLVMENLLFKRNLTRLYDLKGSSRSRYNPDSTGNNKVLLDQNLIESMPTSPIFVGNKAKRLLERAVWNDTAFLASVDVMDYSLLVGVDEENQELVLGIIDFMRQYTWDKHLETWVKASGILGGPKNASPTVISPKQYKIRFRKAMTTYFLMVPDQWSHRTIVPSASQTELSEDNSEHAHSVASAE